MQTRRTGGFKRPHPAWCAALLAAAAWIVVEFMVATRPSAALLAHWGGEKTFQETLHGGHGIPSGDVVFEEGIIGDAFHLHEGGRIEFPPLGEKMLEGLPGLTIEAWVRPELAEGRSSQQTWIRGGMATAIHLWINRHWRDQGFRQLFEMLLEPRGQDLALDPDTFTHVAITLETHAGLARLFLNGVKMAETRLGTFGRTQRYPLRLGVEDPVEGKFIGWIDELAIHGRVLPDDEIRLSHQAGLRGECRATAGLGLARLLWPIWTAAAGFLLGLTLAFCPRSTRDPNAALPGLAPARWPGLKAASAGLAAGLAVTSVAAWQVRQRALEHDRESFEQATHALLDMINTRLELLAQAVESVAAWHGRMKAGMTDDLWRRHIDGMRLGENYGGILEVGVAAIVPDEALQAHEESTRRRLGVDYAVRTAGKNKDMGWTAPVVRHAYSTPTPKHRLPFADYGLDMASIPEQESALELALASSLPAASDCLLLTHLHPQIRAFRLFVSDAAEVGEAEPGAVKPAVGDAVFCTVDLNAFSGALFQTSKPTVEFLIYDHPGGGRDHLLRGDYDRWVLGGEGKSAYLSSSVELLNFKNRLYIDFYSLPSFDAGSVRYWPWVVGAVGTALSALASIGIFLQTRARDKERLVLHNLRSTHERLQEALRERVRLSRDLHDVVIQTIYAVALGLHACRNMAAKEPSQAAQALESNAQELYRVIELLRGFIANQREDGVPAEPFSTALENLVLGMQRLQAAALRLDLEPGAAEMLEESHGPHLLGIAREAISNSFKHSGATEVQVRLDRQNGHIRLTISDNGRGLPRGEPPESCHGLRNMAARADEIGAAFDIQSMDGRFTSVTVSVPKRRDVEAGHGG